MPIDYDFHNDLNLLYNGSINYDVSSADHDNMLASYNNLKAHIANLWHWRDTALELSRLHGEAEADATRLAEEYESTLREIGGVFWEEPGERSPALIAHKNRKATNYERMVNDGRHRTN